jgi:hypothetical protein
MAARARPTRDASRRDGKLAASLTTAFLLLLERLTPKERAAYLLHDIFNQSYAEIAAMLEMDEAACRVGLLDSGAASDEGRSNGRGAKRSKSRLESCRVSLTTLGIVDGFQS